MPQEASECENSSDMNAADKNLNDTLDATNNLVQDKPDTDNNKLTDTKQGRGKRSMTMNSINYFFL